MAKTVDDLKVALAGVSDSITALEARIAAIPAPVAEDLTEEVDAAVAASARIDALVR